MLAIVIIRSTWHYNLFTTSEWHSNFFARKEKYHIILIDDPDTMLRTKRSRHVKWSMTTPADHHGRSQHLRPDNIFSNKNSTRIPSNTSRSMTIPTYVLPSWLTIETDTMLRTTSNDVYILKNHHPPMEHFRFELATCCNKKIVTSTITHRQSLTILAINPQERSPTVCTWWVMTHQDPWQSGPTIMADRRSEQSDR